VLHLLAHHQNKIESSTLQMDTEVRDSLSISGPRRGNPNVGSLEKKEKATERQIHFETRGVPNEISMRAVPVDALYSRGTNVPPGDNEERRQELGSFGKRIG